MTSRTDAPLPYEPMRREDFDHALREMGTYVDISLDDLMQLQQAAQQHARQRRRESLGVDQLMSQPVKTVGADCSLAYAAHLLVSRRISGLPVVDDQQRLLGIITEADFLRALGIPSHHPTHSLWQTLEHMFSHKPQMPQADGRVADLMVTDVICIAPADSLHHALQVMKQHQVKRLVVCNEQRQVVGMITRSDLVRVFFDHFHNSDESHEEGKPS
jgi:CBS-domain-containing membrane protein